MSQVTEYYGAQMELLSYDVDIRAVAFLFMKEVGE